MRTTFIPQKPANWCPNPLLFLGVLALNYGTISLLPYAAGTSSFNAMVVASRAFAFTVLIMPNIVPEAWGTVHPHPHAAYGAYNMLFQAMSVASFVLHGKSTVTSLLFNAPEAHYHRHSIRIPFDTAERSAWEQTTTAVGKVLGATADHPVVAAVGRDVMLSALSLGLWAAVRALDSRDVLLSAIPFYKTHHTSLAEEVAGMASDETHALKQESPAAGTLTTEAESTGRKKSTRMRVSTAKAAESHDDTSTGSRRRGRPKKSRTDPEEVPGDETYVPDEKLEIAAGDVVPTDEADFEVTALTWGLTVLGGLGCGSAGVFGGECISR
jgi:hypothetical protein